MPQRPSDVRIVHRDGSVLPLELVYGGTDEDGCHIWLSGTALDIDAGDSLRVGGLPGNTAIKMAPRP